MPRAACFAGSAASSIACYPRRRPAVSPSRRRCPRRLGARRSSPPAATIGFTRGTCDQRRYVIGSIKYVKQALIASGEGWLDADPEIRRLKPDIYAVNEDGDKGGKREYCERMGIEYLVLQRTPAPGLPRRSSTDLRGF